METGKTLRQEKVSVDNLKKEKKSNLTHDRRVRKRKRRKNKDDEILGL